MPVNWVDGVTPVNAANLETMEADTAAKQAAAEKAQANGYAPLDASAKVPLVHLPPVSGVDYIGGWGAGTPYKRGDVVRYNGNDYLAVNDSTGVTPPAAYAPPLGGVGLGTTLPASPYDGQEFVLTDSLTAPTYTWRFRYNAASASAYKWEFIGGSAQTARVDTSQVGSAGAVWIDLTTVGPQLAVPRTGEYLLEATTVINSGSPNESASIGISDNGAISPVSFLATAIDGSRAGAASTGFVRGRRDLTEGWIPRLRYFHYTAGTAFGKRSLWMTPVRVA
jgi:hypothetical protein